ncbi:MAG: Stk1 family PASTA domain-containing Ser/Thr kinase [Propionibacteriaceae bacterium]|nr:Stk1 family PASTA domain-containing Ser/Thr kinase [Propionibacteriaceae bacterium]
MARAHHDVLIGTVLGDRYEITAYVDHGGSAVVYRAIDRRLGRTVAVKVIHSDLAGDPDYIARFDREARATAILSHPNIVAVFDRGWIAERPYIVMEFIRGQSLRTIIKSSAPLPVETALSYANDIALGIAAAHAMDIIHRDIKPENVLITANQDLKVTDFGLAKDITAHTSAASQGVIWGSIKYIAPEIPDTGSAAKASDVYSTGVVLFEMLTGQQPHQGKEISQVLWKHMNEDVPAPSTALPSSMKSRIPDYVDALVVATTRRAPEQRWSDGRILQENISLVRQRLAAGVSEDPKLTASLMSYAPGADDTPRIDLPRPSTVPVVTNSDDTPIQTKAAAVTKLAQVAQIPQKFKKNRRTTPKKDNDTASRKLLPRKTWAIIFGVLAVVLGLTWWLALGQWTKIPALAGMSEQEARSEAGERGLKIETMQEYSETVAEGLVIRTEPAEGSRVQRASTIIAHMSRGPERYPMPTVVGLTVDEATAAIEDSHLSIGTIKEVWHDTAAVGEVVSASQDPGASLKPDTAIDLSVSKGREPIKVDDYTGKPKDEAVKALEAAGFVVKTTEDFSPKHAAGLVAIQKPAEGTLFKGDTVELVISKGPRMVVIPDVRHKSLADAKTIIAKNFTVATKVDSTIGAPLNIAKGTDPPAGTTAPEGSTVTILVG